MGQHVLEIRLSIQVPAAEGFDGGVDLGAVFSGSALPTKRHFFLPMAVGRF